MREELRRTLYNIIVRSKRLQETIDTLLSDTNFKKLLYFIYIQYNEDLRKDFNERLIRLATKYEGLKRSEVEQHILEDPEFHQLLGLYNITETGDRKLDLTLRAFLDQLIEEITARLADILLEYMDRHSLECFIECCKD